MRRKTVDKQIAHYIELGYGDGVISEVARVSKAHVVNIRKQYEELHGATRVVKCQPDTDTRTAP